jgi:hypothetical protein
MTAYNHTTGSRVYVTQESDLNLSKATRFGTLTFLLPKHKHITVSAESALRELRSKLINFSDDDFILPLGDPLAIALAIFVAAEMNDGVVNVLKWDNEMKDYYNVSVDMYDQPDTN